MDILKLRKKFEEEKIETDRKEEDKEYEKCKGEILEKCSKKEVLLHLRNNPDSKKFIFLKLEAEYPLYWWEGGGRYFYKHNYRKIIKRFNKEKLGYKINCCRYYIWSKIIIFLKIDDNLNLDSLHVPDAFSPPYNC